MPQSSPRARLRATLAAVVLGCTFGVHHAVFAIGPHPIAWRVDLNQARSEAKATNRLIWIQFTGPWCHNCRRMEHESFNDPRVTGHAASDFIPVKLRSDVHEDLALGFGLSSLPATVILRPGGEVVAKVQGYVAPDSYVSFLQSTLAGEGRSGPRALADAIVPATGPPSQRPPALGGYCPVSLVDGHRLVAGGVGVTAEHGGAVYRFASVAGRDAFRNAPERYVPVNGGRCAVAQVDRGVARAGSPNWGALFGGHLFLFGDETDRARFLKRPARYTHVDGADRGFCPHCWAVDRWLVRDKPTYSLTRGGLRDVFPEPATLVVLRPGSATVRR